MGKSATTSDNFLKLLLNATPWANVADNAASSPATSFYLALHTASPGAGGTQSTNEIAYTNYARVAVVRSAAGWTVAGSSAHLTSAITFPTSGSNGQVATYASLGMAASGAGVILYYGALSSPVDCDISVQPVLSISSTITES